MNPNPDPQKHKEIALFNTETWMYEDFEVGAKVRSIRRTISEGEAMAFNALVLDMHPYVADEIFAREEGVFGKPPGRGRHGVQRRARAGGAQQRQHLQLRL